jgi:hypothetical protein
MMGPREIQRRVIRSDRSNVTFTVAAAFASTTACSDFALFN